MVSVDEVSDLLKTNKDPGDRRAQLRQLTPAGFEVLKAAWAARLERIGEMFVALTESER